MRSAEDIKKLIIDIAKPDDRIRAVLLNGSRANPKILPDPYQDFDVVYVVTHFESFISDHRWTDIFGERIIWQLPDLMTTGESQDEVGTKIGFHYLMLLKDGNRIDLTLFPADKITNDFLHDSLTIVWLDKDNAFSNINSPDDFDYLIQRPAEKEFAETCNEFWWVSTYVSKGLLRNEIPYAKEMLETVVRPMFMKIVAWFIGTETNFSVSFGKGGKFMRQYLSDTQYDKILATYSDQRPENNWRSLFTMIELFGDFARTVAARLKFHYLLQEEENVSIYLRKSYHEQKTLRGGSSEVNSPVVE
jgi:aminoglycoside 6-adenylyltransferase